jgi:hypothetical protein
MITEWRFKKLDKYPDRIVCDDGSVYNKYGKKLSLKPGKGRYLRCRMYNKGKEFYIWIHRMVAYAFLGDATGLEVHHKDRNRQNNYYLNLEIMTKQENLALRVYTKQDDCPF